MNKFIYKLAFIILFTSIILVLSNNVCMGKYVITDCKTINISVKIIQQFITEWTLSADNITIVLPITQEPNIAVDWGDGTIESITSTSPSHTYTSSGTYDIKISGELPAWSFQQVSTSRSYITQIKSWGEVGFQNLEGAFYNCTNLKGCIPAPAENSFVYTTNFAYAFYNCSGLTGEIPENLFWRSTNLSKINNMFYGCSNLQGTIPEKLFAFNCSNIESFAGFFGKCSNLTGIIPETLFSNCPSAVTFKETFYRCAGITEIPNNLFENCPNVTIFQNVFAGCDGITGIISTDIFSYCKNATDFIGAFAQCSGITEVYVNTSIIGDKMFYRCNNLTSITITDTVEQIGSQAFYLLTATSDVTNLITNNPIAINYNWENDKRTVQILSITN